MTVKDFINKFTINIFEDIEPHFILEKSKDLDIFKHKGCYNCNDELNSKFLDSEPWTRVQYCWKCNRLNVVIEADRMGGIYKDSIKIYKEK